MLSAVDAINIIGQKLLPNFKLEDPKMLECYEKVFNVFSKSLEIGTRGTKSVFLIGSKGVGKSACMRVMNALFRDTERTFRYIKGSELVKMLDLMKPAEIKERYGFECKSDLYIDDIGLAQVVKKEYGNEINIISEILIERYDLFISEGFKTHLSSNRFFNIDRVKVPDAPRTIYEMYGDVVCDRIKEMATIITWQGESLRK